MKIEWATYVILAVSRKLGLFECCLHFLLFLFKVEIRGRYTHCKAQKIIIMWEKHYHKGDTISVK